MVLPPYVEQDRKLECRNETRAGRTVELRILAQGSDTNEKITVGCGWCLELAAKENTNIEVYSVICIFCT